MYENNRGYMVPGIPRSAWAKPQGEYDFVPIPSMPARGAKGTTMYDEKFDTLTKFEQAMVVPESEFSGVRKALQRYLSNKGLRDKVSMRQKKDLRTKFYTVWLVNEPPQVTIPRSKK